MKQLLLQLARYHQWSSRILFKKLKTVSAEVLNAETGSSFGSINGTLFHLLATEMTWWQRVHLQEQIVLPELNLSTDFGKMSDEILKYTALWINLIQHATDARLEHVFEYRNSKREFYKQPLFEVLMHVFNHQTYHYGQIISILRQQNAGTLPATDFIEFSRKKH